MDDPGRYARLRYLLAVLSFAMVALRMLRPSWEVDQTSFLFFVAGVVLLLAPAILAPLSPHLGGLKKLKLGPVEVELADRIAELRESTERAESETATAPADHNIALGVPEAVKQRLATTAANPQLALILLSAELEDTICKLAGRAGIASSLPVPATMAELCRRPGYGTEAEHRAFRQFWDIRNQIIHGRYGASERHVIESIDLGLRLLRVFRSRLDAKR